MQQIQQKARPFRNTFQVSELSDTERFSQNSYPISVEEDDKMLFDPAARADMIDKALNENCNYDTEQSELELPIDPSGDDTQDILDGLDGSASARKTVENNEKLLAEANTLMAQLKLSLNANEHDAEEGQNAHLQ